MNVGCVVGASIGAGKDRVSAGGQAGGGAVLLSPGHSSSPQHAAADHVEFQLDIVSAQGSAIKGVPFPDLPVSGKALAAHSWFPVLYWAGRKPAQPTAYGAAVIAVVQRVSRAAVWVEEQPISSIQRGLVVLAAIERDDGEAQARWMAAKLAGLRVFPDEAQLKGYDRDVRQVRGSILLVSNFTVAAVCEKGRRPSLEDAAPPQEAEPVFNRLTALLKKEGASVETGRFGAMMQVELLNEGPVTVVVRTPPASPA